MSELVQDERGGLPSASGGDKWYNCAGSVALERQAPPDEPTDEAIEGELIHEARKNESDEELDDAGRNISQRLAAMEADGIQDWAIAFDLDREKLKSAKRYREERFWIHDRNTMAPAASAKNDFSIIFQRHALANDYKTGYIETPPARVNIQMRIQAIALWHQFDHIQNVRVCVSRYRFTGKFDFCDYTLEDLQKAERELFFRIWLTQQEYAPRVPGPWCKYCRAKAFCPENRAMTMLPMVALDMTKIQKMSKEEIHEAVMRLDLQSLAFVAHHRQQIKDTCDAIVGRLKNFSDKDLATVGLQKKPSEGVRTLPDIQKAWAVMFAAGITPEQFQGACKITIGAAEKTLVAKLKKDAEAAGTTLNDTAAKEMAAKILRAAVVMDPRDPQLRSL